MKYFGTLFTVSLLFSCTGDFVNHKLSYEKLGSCDDERISSVNMSANIAGERYTFDICLGDDFNEEKYRVTQSSDTIKVLFPKSRTNPKTFKITLDIDARPAYHIIVIDNHIVPLVVNKNSNEQN